MALERCPLGNFFRKFLRLRFLHSEPTKSRRQEMPPTARPSHFPILNLNLELVLMVIDFLDPISASCLRLTCRRLYHVTPRARPSDFTSCEEWQLKARFEKDYKTCPDRVVCTFCQRYRPRGDFGYGEPQLAKERDFNHRRRIPLMPMLLNSGPGPHSDDLPKIEDQLSKERWNDDPEMRTCYRHDQVYKSSPVNVVRATITPALTVDLRDPTPTTHYFRFVMQCCLHCGDIMAVGHSREFICKNCDCTDCGHTERYHYFRPGEALKHGMTVEHVLLQLGRKDATIAFEAVRYDPSYGILERESVLLHVGSCWLHGRNEVRARRGDEGRVRIRESTLSATPIIT